MIYVDQDEIKAVKDETGWTWAEAEHEAEKRKASKLLEKLDWDDPLVSVVCWLVEQQ